MTGLLLGVEMTFGEFVKQFFPVASRREVVKSFIKPGVKFKTMLMAKNSKLSLINNEFVHVFDESYLLPMSEELGISPIKTLKIIALRNAWISYFQRSTNPEVLCDEESNLLNSKAARDYILLTSKSWMKHPWVQKQLHAPESYPWVSIEEQWHHAQWEAGMSWMKEDIFFVIGDFQSKTKSYSTDLERDADYAKIDIKSARIAILEFREEIKKQEAIIESATRPITKQNRVKPVKRSAPGKPKISENDALQARRDIAMKFVVKWINSLMSVLELDSCDQLAKYVSGSKMNWWRWLNQETLPTSKSLRPLLDVKIKTGDFQRKALCEIQTSPSLLDLVTLIELV